MSLNSAVRVLICGKVAPAYLNPSRPDNILSDNWIRQNLTQFDLDTDCVTFPVSTLNDGGFVEFNVLKMESAVCILGYPFFKIMGP